MNKIRFSVGQASGIAVQEVNADATSLPVWSFRVAAKSALSCA